MNTAVGLYASHEKAIEAVLLLGQAGYPVQKVSLLGKAVIIDDLLYVKSNKWIKNVPVTLGAILGPILGILTGMNVLAIPGFGFLSGTGVMLGALAGFSMGIVAGGVPSLFATLVIKTRAVLKYKEHTEERGFRVIAHGTSIEIEKAREILRTHPGNIEAKCD